MQWWPDQEKNRVWDSRRKCTGKIHSRVVEEQDWLQPLFLAHQAQLPSCCTDPFPRGVTTQTLEKTKSSFEWVKRTYVMSVGYCYELYPDEVPRSFQWEAGCLAAAVSFASLLPAAARCPDTTPPRWVTPRGWGSPGPACCRCWPRRPGDQESERQALWLLSC